jgi:uncharacterized membrane protein YphA (DoxX/SURF4 family)
MTKTSRSRTATRLSWACQIAAAAILAQTLFFKFTYAPETQWIFGEKLHVGRAGATATGFIELVCVVLLLIPGKAIYGAMLAALTMGGAVASHLFILGIDAHGDGGLLFALALSALTLSLVVFALRRDELRRDAIA